MSKLIEAVQAGDIEQVKKIVEELESVNVGFIDEIDRSGMTPLMWACMLNKVDIADYLLDHKADVDKKASSMQSHYGNTALIFACRGGFIEVVKSLLNAKANVNIQNAAGVSALTIAAEAGDLRVLELLVESSTKIDRNIKSHAFYHASLRGHIEVMQYLQVQGVNIDISYLTQIGDKYCYENALISAVRCGSLDVVGLLLNMGAHNAPSSSRFDPLRVAVESGRYDVTALLFDRGVVGCKDKKGRSILISAVLSENLELVKLVVRQQGGIDDQDIYRNSPLMFAVANDQIEIAKFLIACGASMENVNIVINSMELSYEIEKLVLAALEVDSILNGGSVNDIKFYPEYVEVMANRIMYNLTNKTTINTASLEKYLTKYSAHISPEIVAQIQEAVIVYKVAEILYSGGPCPDYLDTFSEEMIENICKSFDMRMKNFGAQNFDLIREVVARGELPEALAQKIMNIIEIVFTDLKQLEPSIPMKGSACSGYEEVAIELAGEVGGMA